MHEPSKRGGGGGISEEYKVTMMPSEEGLPSNIGVAGSRLKVRRQGKYQSFVTLAESKPSHKTDGSRLSYSTSSPLLAEFLV